MRKTRITRHMVIEEILKAIARLEARHGERIHFHFRLISMDSKKVKR